MSKVTVLGLAVLLSTAADIGNAAQPTAQQIGLAGQTVKIVRDRYGVPRVFAPTLESLFAGDGYAVAADRAWQMEKYRLDAEGRLAEVFGKAFILHDQEVRRDGLTREELREEFAQLPPRNQRILKAYGEGVNIYFDRAQASGSLSLEFKKYGVKPEPWTIEDSMAIMAMMGRRFGGSGIDQLENEVAIRDLTSRLGERKAMEVFNDLAWVNDPAAIPTVGSKQSAAGSKQSVASPLRSPLTSAGGVERVPHLPLDTGGLYRGTASAAPTEANRMAVLAAAADDQGLKPQFKISPFAARLKPCPDTSLLGCYRTTANSNSTPGIQPKIWVKGRALLSGSNTFLNRLDRAMNSAAVFVAAQKLGLATRWGSYSWVISPSRSVSGHAILIGGPQMGFQTPQIAHEIQLTGAGFDVIGMDFAGIPGVLIGANKDLAWTSTSGESHNEDVFVEKLKTGDPHEYFYRGGWRPMERRVEQILVKGSATVNQAVYRTVHGPVVGWSPDHTVAYSKAMTYFGQEYQNIIGFLGLNTARRIQDVPQLCRDITSNHNIIAATVEGDIGFWHCGLFPEYPSGADPRLPLLGTGQDDWKGFVPFNEIPQGVDPRTGTLFNWNNKPAPAWKNYSVPAWGVVFRISNIRDALRRRLHTHDGKLSFTDVLSIAPEIGRHNFRADYLKPGLIAAANRHPSEITPRMRQALTYLQHWDNEAREDGIAQTIFDAWYERLRWDLFRPVVGDLGSAKNFDRFVNPSSVVHVLAGPQSSVELSYDYLAGRSEDTVQLRALAEAVHQLKAERGPEMSAWLFHFPWIKFDPLPSIPWYSRGTYIQAVELDPAGVHGVWILPPGESENPESPHFRDQLFLASWWMFAPMRLISPSGAP